MPKRAIIFINGDLPDSATVKKLILPSDFLLAVDGGTRHALNLGLLPAVVIGDLDSLDSAHRLILEREGVEIIQYPPDKDETDFELALDYVIQRGYEEILLIAALGGRLDQTLGNLSLLTAESRAGLDLRLDDGSEEVFFVRKHAKIHGRIGEVVSLIPWGGDVSGICTEGLRWSLQNERLYAHKTRGISNEMIAEDVEIQTEDGLLLVIHTKSPSVVRRSQENNYPKLV